MTKISYTCSRKMTRKELADKLRKMADHIEGTNVEYYGELLVDEKGDVLYDIGVANSYFTITGLKTE